MAENELSTNTINSSNTGTVTIDGQEYVLEQLSEEARQQVINLRVTDMEIARLKQQIAIAGTARASYANALKNALPSD